MMVPIMRDSGKVEKETVLVFILKKTEFFIKASGSMIKNMVKVKLFIKMVMKFLENGSMIDLMVWLKSKDLENPISKM
jgi:hypothetical protein